ncbi:hypothetical protein [Streptantibioticus silvisoli]|uniref:Nucleopolyhedrovirus P10 family protein n=1 Tax=Streptantibioticus silvisoli TaxID=2705255 RepID=A0ABT6VX70_9ACTN|nr:hypothetical protein [Streptantibioticus silvisoli]MDI5963097.1 hypothetical protein [Streptantibioticus silvisoli]
MTADGLLQAVRGQVGAGRTLPLGGPADGCWITERAVARVLREAERTVPGVALDRVRVRLADPDAHDWGAVRTANPAAPPSAMPAGPLRIEADFAARPDRPLPRTADLLRAVLAALAADRLGLVVTAIDLRAVGLLGPLDADRPMADPDEAGLETGPDAAAGPVGDAAGADGPADAVVAAALKVGGVRGAAARWTAGGVRAYVTVDGGFRALDVAVAVRTAVTVAAAGERAAADGPAPATAVVVTGAG